MTACGEKETGNSVNEQFQQFLNSGESSNIEKNIDKISEYVYTPEIISSAGDLAFEAVQAIAADNALAVLFKITASEDVDIKTVEAGTADDEVLVYKGDIAAKISGSDFNAFKEENKSSLIDMSGKFLFESIEADETTGTASYGLRYAVKDNNVSFEANEKYTIVLYKAGTLSAVCFSTGEIIKSRYEEVSGEVVDAKIRMSPLAISMMIEYSEYEGKTLERNIEMKDKDENSLLETSVSETEEGTGDGVTNVYFGTTSKTCISQIYDTDAVASISIFGEEFTIDD